MVTSLNVMQTNSGQGLFQNSSSTGYIQGTARPDPATRFGLRQGVLDAGETLPMWGGCAIYEAVPGANPGSAPRAALGPIMGRATSITGGAKPLAGFSVFDQAYNYINTPESPVPIAGSGMSVMSYALGSRARIALAADPILINLRGKTINTPVSFDLVNQILVPYTGADAITSGTYNNTTGVVTLTMTTPVALGPGDSVTVSGLTGTGAFASLNGTFTTIAPTDGTTVTYQTAAGLGASTITGGSLTTGAQLTGVSILDIQPTNNMTVAYNSATGLATWNYSGCCALVQI